MKKTRGQKSRATVPLKDEVTFNVVNTLYKTGPVYTYIILSPRNFSDKFLAMTSFRCFAKARNYDVGVHIMMNFAHSMHNVPLQL